MKYNIEKNFCDSIQKMFQYNRCVSLHGICPSNLNAVIPTAEFLIEEGYVTTESGNIEFLFMLPKGERNKENWYETLVVHNNQK